MFLSVSNRGKRVLFFFTWFRGELRLTVTLVVREVGKCFFQLGYDLFSEK